MGLFVNPDQSAFQSALNAQIYVDKSGLIEYTNSVLESTDAFICNSRPRRFGKSITADMLTAYYSRGCDSRDMFATVYKGNIIKNLIMDCQSYTKYRPNETTGGIFVSWRRKEELPTGA